MKIGTFSWRLIVGWFLILFGGVACGVMVIALITHLVSLQLTPSHPVFKGSLLTIAIGATLQFAAAIIWLLSGRRVLAKQRWQPILGCLLGYVCGVLGAMTLWPGGV